MRRRTRRPEGDVVKARVEIVNLLVRFLHGARFPFVPGPSVYRAAGGMPMGRQGKSRIFPGSPARAAIGRAGYTAPQRTPGGQHGRTDRRSFCGKPAGIPVDGRGRTCRAWTAGGDTPAGQCGRPCDSTGPADSDPQPLSPDGAGVLRPARPWRRGTGNRWRRPSHEGGCEGYVARCGRNILSRFGPAGEDPPQCPHYRRGPRDAYRIEKIIFESRRVPGDGTSNRQGPQHPPAGVVGTCGHSESAKAIDATSPSPACPAGYVVLI